MGCVFISLTTQWSQVEVEVRASKFTFSGTTVLKSSDHVVVSMMAYVKECLLLPMPVQLHLATEGEIWRERCFEWRNSCLLWVTYVI